jgi:hypothetical protein
LYGVQLSIPWNRHTLVTESEWRQRVREDREEEEDEREFETSGHKITVCDGGERREG